MKECSCNDLSVVKREWVLVYRRHDSSAKPLLAVFTAQGEVRPSVLVERNRKRPVSDQRILNAQPFCHLRIISAFDLITLAAFMH